MKITKRGRVDSLNELLNLAFFFVVVFFILGAILAKLYRYLKPNKKIKFGRLKNLFWIDRPYWQRGVVISLVLYVSLWILVAIVEIYTSGQLTCATAEGSSPCSFLQYLLWYILGYSLLFSPFIFLLMLSGGVIGFIVGKVKK